MTELLLLKPGFVTQIQTGGKSVQVADPSLGSKGGIIVNPLTAKDQGVPVAEDLFISLLGTAVLHTSPTTNRLVPGQWFLVPPNCNVWVNAVSTGHKFTAFFTSFYTPQYPPIPVPGQPGIPGGVGAVGGESGAAPFPPPGVTGLTTVIPSYLYQEYSDDDDLQGFVDAQNEMQQNFVDTFNALNLPIYTGVNSLVQGALLDWVGRGVYGMARPALDSGKPNLEGPLNTYGCNWLVPMWDLPIDPNVAGKFGINMIALYGPENVVITNDDIYRRVLTWHFYKGDGKYFSTPWLKRRVWRFLYGLNGTSPESVDWWQNDSEIADHEQISVSFGPNRNVTIRFVLGKRTVAGGALLNFIGCNGFNPAFEVAPPWTIWEAGVTMNDLEGPYEPYPALPYMTTFKTALDSGVLEVPYQYHFTCQIG